MRITKTLPADAPSSVGLESAVGKPHGAPGAERETFFTIPECAQSLRLSVSTIRRRIASGFMRCLQHAAGMAIRIPCEECTAATSREIERQPKSSIRKKNKHASPSSPPPRPGPRPQWQARTR